VGTLLYIRLVGYTFGTLLMLFWMVVILGYRRQRNFERVFFFLCLALFLFYSGSLLAINAQIYYTQPSAALETFAAILICVGLTLLPALLFHLHVEFAEIRGFAGARRLMAAMLAVMYLPAIYFGLVQVPDVLRNGRFDFGIPGNSLGRWYLLWLIAAAALGSAWEIRLTHATRVKA